MIAAPKFYGTFAPSVSAIHHICTTRFHRPKWGHLNPCRVAFAHSGPTVSGWGALFLEGGLPPPALGTLNEKSMNGISGGFGDQVGRGLGMAPRCGGRRYQLVGVADADVAPLRRCNLRFPTPGACSVSVALSRCVLGCGTLSWSGPGQTIWQDRTFSQFVIRTRSISGWRRLRSVRVSGSCRLPVAVGVAPSGAKERQCRLRRKPTGDILMHAPVQFTRLMRSWGPGRTAPAPAKYAARTSRSFRPSLL